MTRAPHAPPLRLHGLAEAVAAIRERGLRLSTPRRLILEHLFARQSPVSAEELARALALDLAVTYRNLETLEAHGLVHHVHLGHGPGLYALVGQGDQEYLYCETCGSILAVDPSELDSLRAQIRERFDFHARFTHFPIVGSCDRCAAPTANNHGHTGRPRRSPKRGDRGPRQTGPG